MESQLAVLRYRVQLNSDLATDFTPLPGDQEVIEGCAGTKCQHNLQLPLIFSLFPGAGSRGMGGIPFASRFISKLQPNRVAVYLYSYIYYCIYI